MMLPYCLVKPFVFALDPETAHELTLAGLAALQKTGVLPAYRPLRASPVTVMGLEFPNRVGLAAGLDKNGEIIDALATWGFGFVEVGTVTPRPQPGNPRPRLFRLPEAQGFDQPHGLQQPRHRLRRRQTSGPPGSKGILGINIGKNFDTPNEKAVDDYLALPGQGRVCPGQITSR
jgi:dihydroorotate dehydrogenase